MYNGRSYRSRLEAKWQCMFDYLGWQSEYEPVEINGYNPDFIIRCTSSSYPTNSIIVEVKPSVMIDDKLINETLLKYETAKAHILIVSDFPFLSELMDDQIPIGVGSQYFGVDTKPDNWDDEDVFGKWSPNLPRSDMHKLFMKGIDDFSSDNVLWDGMVRGTVERKQFITPRYPEYQKLVSMWTACGNKTQFKVK